MIVAWISDVMAGKIRGRGMPARRPAVCLGEPRPVAVWSAPRPTGPQYFVGLADANPAQMDALSTEASAAGVRLVWITDFDQQERDALNEILDDEGLPNIPVGQGKGKTVDGLSKKLRAECTLDVLKTQLGRKLGRDITWP